MPLPRSVVAVIFVLIAAFLLPPDTAGAIAAARRSSEEPAIPSLGQHEEPAIPSLNQHEEPESLSISQHEEPAVPSLDQHSVEASGRNEEVSELIRGRESLEVSEEETPEGDLSVEAEEKTIVLAPDSPYGLDGKKIFNPDPTRAVWLSALFPGLGQIYNRRYWKLPIVVGGFMGLVYATNWNNNQYSDYSQAFRDITDTDPDTKSYMNFFPPTTNEADLDMGWLSSVMRSRKNYYRRNRDLCIICMVALYLLCMVDAYVDASMAHFDISPDLSLDMTPTMMVNPGDRRVSLGLNWAFTF